MKFLTTSLLSMFLFTACRQSDVQKPPVEPSAITDSIIEKDTPIEEYPPMKVLWVHKSLAAQIASDLNSLILFYVYSNEYQPSVDMDLKTFGDSKVASHINSNFVSIRAEYRQMAGLFSPGTTMILAPNGDILLTVIGYVDSKAMIGVLSHSKFLNSMLKQKKSHGKPQLRIKPVPMPQPHKKEERKGNSFLKGRSGIDI